MTGDSHTTCSCTGEEEVNSLRYTVAKVHDLPFYLSQAARFILLFVMVHNFMPELTCKWCRVHAPLLKGTLQFHVLAAEHGCQERDQSGNTSQFNIFSTHISQHLSLCSKTLDILYTLL